MSKYGLKIKNFQAGSIYEYNLGVRSNYDTTDAMFVNSLFKDFMMQHGLSVWKDESTRDIICLEFDYGSRCYDEEAAHLRKKIEELDNSVEYTQEELKRRKEILSHYSTLVEANKHKYIKVSKQDIRTIFYRDGVDITYTTHNKKGKVIKSEVIHYKMLYRSAGKAKQGSCMFINEKLYDVARDYIHMGMKLPYENAPIVELGAYSSLIASSIVDKIRIDPSEILVLKDVSSEYITNAISIELDENNHCVTREVKGINAGNEMFDGQALIDSSIFPEWADGYVLLRQHFCKMAAFNTNIQLFFKDYFGDNYSTATVKDMWGNEIPVNKIKLITTNNALKWLKFNVSYEYWSDRVRADDCMFGIVKTTHESKLGDVQRMSYQMVNSLDIRYMPNVMKLSTTYIDQLKNNDDVFIDYLKKNKTFSNDFEVLVALVEQDRDFIKSDYFRQRRTAIISAYVLNMKNGRIIQNADNLTIVGSPYAMLLHSVGENVEDDPTFEREDIAIQCYTDRFADGEYLAEFRSPFNSRNNLGYLHNKKHPYMQKYFNFGKLVIAINMLHTSFQNRNNGSDQDSDSIYVTNQEHIVGHAKYCMGEYKTIVNNIPQEKSVYTNDIENYALIDNALASAQLAIGESSNLAQITLSYSYNFDDPKYQSYVCILAIIAQIAIDSAKRRYNIDIAEEIKLIKDDMDLKTNGYPAFWSVIRNGFDRKKINYNLICPMNEVYKYKVKSANKDYDIIPISDFFVKYKVDPNRRKNMQVEKLIEKYSLDLYEYRSNEDLKLKDDRQYYLMLLEFERLIDEIKRIYVSNNYMGLMSWLIDRAFIITPPVQGNKYCLKSRLNKNRALLLKVLYDINPECLLKCFSKNAHIKIKNTNKCRDRVMKKRKGNEGGEQSMPSQ